MWQPSTVDCKTNIPVFHVKHIYGCVTDVLLFYCTIHSMQAQYVLSLCLSPLWSCTVKKLNLGQTSPLNDRDACMYMCTMCVKLLHLWGFLKIFPQWLEIVNQNFTCLMCAYIHAILQNFNHLSLTLTKLCHIQFNHLVNFYILPEKHQILWYLMMMQNGSFKSIRRLLSWIFKIENFNGFALHTSETLTFCICLLNFVEIRHTTTEIMRYFVFFWWNVKIYWMIALSVVWLWQC